MPVIAVDIGNSALKLAFGVSSSLEVLSFSNDSRFNISQIAQIDRLRTAALNTGNGGSAVVWSICSVHSIRLQEFRNLVQTRFPHDSVLVIQPQDVDLKTHVQAPEKLGRDRLIATWQATQLTTHRPLIVVDAGTAVTIDFVGEQGDHLGGLIYPGAESMLKILGDQTDALPMLAGHNPASLQIIGLSELSSEHAPPNPPRMLPFSGSNTDAAILLGVYHCQVATIESTVRQAAGHLGDFPTVFLTGGGISAILPYLSQDWQYVPDLLLRGIQAIGSRRC